jgi:hypothetical protein
MTAERENWADEMKRQARRRTEVVQVAQTMLHYLGFRSVSIDENGSWVVVRMAADELESLVARLTEIDKMAGSA